MAVDRAWREGANIVILSDRGVDENHVAIPSLLAVSAMEQHLIRTKKRTAVSILLESAEPREVHHFAALLGYGARAVNPYLAEETIVELIEEGLLDKDFHTAVRDYNAAVLHGIVKIASKMGISTLQSYQSAQIFEAVGISRAVIDRYFTNTVSRVGGIGLEEIAAMVERNHARAFDPLGLDTDLELDSLGEHKARAGGEDHLYNPRPSTCSSRPPAGGTTAFQAVHRPGGRRDQAPHPPGAAGHEVRRRRPSPWTRWRAWTPSSGASRPGP